MATETEKSISEQLDSVLAQLSVDQVRFVVARCEFATDTEAAKAIGIKRDTVYHWPKIVKEAVALMVTAGAVGARHILARNVAKAAAIKAAGLNSKDDKLRQDVASEILDRNLGKAAQPVEHSGEVVIKGYATVSPDDWPTEYEVDGEA